MDSVSAASNSHSPLYFGGKRAAAPSDVTSMEGRAMAASQPGQSEDFDKMMKMQLAANRTQRARFDPNATLQTVKFGRAAGAAFGVPKNSEFVPSSDRSRQRQRPALLKPEHQTVSGQMFR